MTDPTDLRDLAADLPAGSLIAGTLLAAADEIAQLREQRARYRTAWRLARTRARSAAGAADRYASRAAGLQAALSEIVPWAAFAQALGPGAELQPERRHCTTPSSEMPCGVHCRHDLCPDCDNCCACQCAAAGQQDNTPPAVPGFDAAEFHCYRCGATVQAASTDPEAFGRLAAEHRATCRQVCPSA